MKEIYLIRHGRQNSKLCNVNVALSAQGREQAKLLGERLKHYGIEIVYSSHLLRAIETTHVVNAMLEVPHEIRKGIQEIDYGELGGQTEEYIEKHYYSFKEKRKSMESDIAFPSGENGQDVVVRAMPIIEEIKSSPYQIIAMVTHGGTIRSLMAELLGMEQRSKLLFGIHLENCGITKLLYDATHDKFYLERFNDYAHLENREDLLRNNWE